jgi:hypothetical protein
MIGIKDPTSNVRGLFVRRPSFFFFFAYHVRGLFVRPKRKKTMITGIKTGVGRTSHEVAALHPVA